MQSVKEIVATLVDFYGKEEKPDPDAARHHWREAVISYAQALKRSPARSKEENERHIQEAYEQAARAISLGMSEDRIESSFAKIRAVWLPRLKEREK